LLKKGNLTFKIFLFLVSVDFLETLTQFCFKKTALPESAFEINALADILVFLKLMLFSPFLWLGLVSVLFTFIIWSTILSHIDLSVAVPVCSFSYITIPLVSIIFFHEKLSYLRWMGIFLILIGVILVSVSTNHKEAVE
jgi:drug/metabolite transporter (DMT)-like permease